LSAFWVARITGMSPRHPARNLFLNYPLLHLQLLSFHINMLSLKTNTKPGMVICTCNPSHKRPGEPRSLSPA
jgi:hypothetical protein